MNSIAARTADPVAARDVTPAIERNEIAKWLEKVEASDVLDALTDADAQLQQAMKHGDAALIGRIVLNVRKAYATQIACRWLYEGTVKVPSVCEAADMAMRGVAL